MSAVEPIRIAAPPSVLLLSDVTDLQQRGLCLVEPGGRPLTLRGRPTVLVKELLQLAEEALRLHAVAEADPTLPIAHAIDVAIDQLRTPR